MAGSKTLKEGGKVSRIKGAIAAVRNDSNCKEIYF